VLIENAGQQRGSRLGAPDTEEHSRLLSCGPQIRSLSCCSSRMANFSGVYTSR
jgi:hypothetical protein